MPFCFVFLYKKSAKLPKRFVGIESKILQAIIAKYGILIMYYALLEVKKIAN